MSAEKLIQEIKNDSQQEIDKINKETEKKLKEIQKEAEKKAEQIAQKTFDQAKKQIENKNRIKTSKARHDSQREIMKIKEQIIDEAFQKAIEKLKELKSQEYQEIINKIITKTIKNLGKNPKITVSRKEDEEIAKKHNIKITGRTQSIGGVILQSEDNKITMNYTFEAILKREKENIRIQIGNLLFS